MFVRRAVPGSPPYGLAYESISPSEVNVTWRPPLLPNGVITHYSLELWNSTHYLNLTSQTSSIRISHLRKYANYRVVVQAHTQAGPGNYSSEPLNVTTLEDGKGRGFVSFCFSAPAVHSGRGRATSDFQLLPFPPDLNTSASNTGIMMLFHRSRQSHNCRARRTEVIPWDDFFLMTIFLAPIGLWRGFNVSCHFASSDVLSIGGSFSPLYNLSCISAPDTPPQFLRAQKVSDYEVELSWQPPLEANSDILYYVVRVW